MYLESTQIKGTPLPPKEKLMSFAIQFEHVGWTSELEEVPKVQRHLVRRSTSAK